MSPFYPSSENGKCLECKTSQKMTTPELTSQARRVLVSEAGRGPMVTWGPGEIHNSDRRICCYDNYYLLYKSAIYKTVERKKANIVEKPGEDQFGST